MSRSAVLTSVRRLRSLLAVQHGHEQSDEQLLTAFIERRDDVAFATLVRRHGPMVLGVCRRVLGHEQDAEDAFQATFLVLARRVASLRNKSALAGFLHGTAYHLASRAKRAAGRRRKHEGGAPARLTAEPADELLWREVRELLDEETARLPEKYRSVFVLCCLEELSQAEAARRLGLKVGTVSSRLTVARKMLSQRLARRGVELTAVLTATTLAVAPAAALPVGPTAKTIEAALAVAAGEGLAGLVSASVAELVEGVASTVTLGQAKMVAALLLSATLLAGAGAWACRTLAMPQPAEPPAKALASPQATQGNKDKTPRQQEGEGVAVMGRVLDPDGKPIEGARLYWPRVPKEEPLSEDDIEIPQRGKTDSDGRFRFELPRSDIKPDWNLSLIAAADGYGVAWAEWSAIEKGGELTLRLVKDHPIEGRIVTSEGKPVAGARVTIIELGAMREGKVDAFVTGWKREWQAALQQSTERMFMPMEKILNITPSDKDGRFRILGAGADRLVEVRLGGSGIAQEALYVINRAGFDAAAVNKTVFERIPPELRQAGQPPILYGPKISYVVPASRRIEGVVREVGSGKPVPGFRIGMILGYGFGIDAVSDKEGRYQFNGVPKVKQYLLSAEPPEGSSWLRSGVRIDDTEGVQPLTVDFTVARGIVLSGRVVDKTTGKGVKGSIRFASLPGNRFADKPGFDSYKYERLSNLVDADGRFRFAVIPGPGVLMFQADGSEKINGQAINPYMAAEFDAKEREHIQITLNDDGAHFTTIDNSIEGLSIQHAVKYLDLAPDAGAARCELFVQRGQMLTVKIEDADGKPLRGTTVAGVMDGWPRAILIEDAICTVSALDPKKPRRLLFFHSQSNLAGSLTVRGDEKEPPVARLNPTGAVTGRVLDREGQPIAGADVNLSSPDRDASELYRLLDQRRKIIHTDKDGRFRIEGIVPEVKFQLSIQRGRTFLVGEPRIGIRQVKPGETINLGDVRVKPGS